MQIAAAQLEDWFRDYYFTNEIDISSSGVQSFSISELRQLTNFSFEHLDTLVLNDSRSCGDPYLRRLIAERWGSGNPEQVMATHGSSEAIFLIMNTLLHRGDEVIVLDPCYHALVSIAEAIGCSIKRWPLRFAQSYVPDISELKRLLSSRTRMVIVNFPHNPTGASLTLEGQQELINAVANIGAYLVWDEAFAELTYDSAPLPSPCLQYERAISFGTLSKAYGLPGLRVGWCIAPLDVVNRCMQLRDYTTIALSPLIEFIAQRAIENVDRLLTIRLQQAYTNLNFLTEWIDQQRSRVEWVRPAGGVTAFVRIPNVNDIEEFCHTLIRKYGVLLAPGTCFQCPEHVRLGFGGSTQSFREGLSRLSHLLDEYAP